MKIEKALRLVDKKWVLLLFLVIASVIAIYINYSRSGKAGFSNNYLGPYLSASVHYRPGQLFLIDTAEVHKYTNIDNTQKELRFKFQTPGTTYYNHNPVGYIYFIQAGKLIFGHFFGDAQSVVWLQLLMHLIVCCIFWFRLKSGWQRVLFALLYVCNPAVLYLITLNFYYAWQVLPCFGVLILWMDKRITITSLLLLILMPVILCTRPTLIFTAVFFLFYFGYYSRWYWGLLASIFCFATLAFIYAPNKKNPWHSAYVGLGAYPNSNGIHLSDNDGYKLFETVTGKKLNASLGGNYYETETIEEYKNLSKKRTIEIIKEHPFEFIRNFVLNFLQSFTPGYITSRPYWFYILMSLFGGITLFAAIRSHIWVPVLLIIFYSGAFIPYFPPIPAYMFGAYLPIAFIWIKLLERIFQKNKDSGLLKK